MIGPLPGFSTRIVWIAATVLGFQSLARAGDADLLREQIRDGRFARAAGRAGEELAEVGPCAPERVELECLRGEALRRGNEKLAPSTLALAEHSAALACELFGADDPGVAEPLLQLGILHCVRREWPEAKKALERSLDLLRDASAGKNPRQATALAYLAIETLSGDHDGDRALDQLDEADRLLDRLAPGESTDRAWVLDMRGGVLNGIGRTEEALAAYAASVAMRRRTQRGDHPLLAIAVVNLGTLQDIEGRLAEARASYEEVLAILEAGTEIPWTRADVRSKLGAISQELGDTELAQAFFEGAIEELDARGQRATSVYADALDSLARLSWARGDFATAGAQIERCLEALDSARDADPHTRGRSLALAACIEIQEEAYDRAQEFAARARDAGEPMADLPLAWIAAGRGDFKGARDLLHRLVYGDVERRPASRSELPQLLRELSRLSILGVDLDAALEDSLEAGQRAQEEWARAAIGLEETSAIELGENPFLTDELQPAAYVASRLDRPEATERVWDALLASCDRVFHECAERLELSRSAATPESSRARSKLAESRQRLAALYVQSRRSPDAAAFEDAIGKARADRETAEREFAGAARVGRGMDEARLDLHTLRAALEPGTDLVRYCIAERPRAKPASLKDLLHWEDCYYACVLGPSGGHPRILELGSMVEIDGLVASLLRAIRIGVGPAEYLPIATALRRRILDPVLAGLADAKLVHLVPVGKLWFVPFLALCSDSGEYLAEKGPLLHLLGSEEDILGARDPAPTGTGLLALGDPDFASPAGETQESWPALPQTRAEVGAIAAAWRRGSRARENVALLLGADASERRLRCLAPGRRVIHLATHGYYEDALVSVPSVSLNGGRSRGKPRDAAIPTAAPIAPRASPLTFLRSGLAFAWSGANNGTALGENDGILTTEEVLGLDLSGVEWVVLSACDTGLGDLRPTQGVLGLRRALRMAGARTVIASLWPVEDRWAREWMEALYRARFEERLSTAAAVRAASLAVLSMLKKEGEDPLPRRWASFEAVGDWR